MEKYDLIIIGAGPAGMSAGIYASRHKLKTLILSKDLGGLASTAHRICNFPSYNNVNGFELMQKFAKHVKELEKILYISRTKDGFSKIARLSSKSEIKEFLKNEIGVDELFIQNLI